MNDLDVSPFLRLRPHLQIAHHIPGRLRLRLGSTLFKDLGSVDRGVFDRILTAIEGIKEVRLNAAAASVVIHYAPELIAPQLWDTLLRGGDDEATGLLQDLIATRLAPALQAVRTQ